MRISPTLTRYIAKHFVINFLTVFAALLLIVYLADALELLRRASKRPDLSVGIVFKMSLFQLPDPAQELFAFATLFAAMYTFWRMTKTQELIIARAAGISAWEFLWPGVLVAILIGMLKITLINPASALLIERFNEMEARLLRGQSSAFDISANGLWLRQMSPDKYFILHAHTVSQGEFYLNDVNLFVFNAQDQYITRVDASKAYLGKESWLLPDAKITQLSPQSEETATFTFPTDITPDQIENNFASPSALSFWAMPRYIDVMESTGFSATKVRMQYQSLLAQPFLFGGIVLVAAAITLGPPRRTNTAAIIAGGTVVAFALFFLNDVVRALGLDEIIPIIMAAWIPASLTLLAGLGSLLFLEDG